MSSELRLPRFLRYAAIGLLAAANTQLPTASPGQPQPTSQSQSATISPPEFEFSGFASLKAGAATNPFLEANREETAYGEFVISPRLSLRGPTTETHLEASYRHTEYGTGHEGTDEFRVSASHDRSLNEIVELSIDGQFASAVVGQRELAFSDPGIAEPVPDPVEFDPDVSLIGRQRRNFFSGRSRLDIQLNERSAFSGGVSFQRSDYTGAGAGQSFWSYGTSLDYSRTLDPRTKAGIALSAEWTDYDGPSGGSYLVLQPQLRYEKQLNAWLTLEAALGALLVREMLNGASESSIGLGGNVRACAENVRSSLCVTAYREASPTGLGSVRTSTNLSLIYAQRLGLYDNLRLGARYIRVDADAGQVGNAPSANASSLLDLFGSAETRVARNLSMGTTLSYRRLRDPTRGALTDLNGQVFLRLSFGNRR